VCDTVSKGVRLAGPGAGDDEQGASHVTIGADAVLDGAPLFRVERLKIRCGLRSEHESVLC
jgi:hypothetical protein